MTPWGFATSGSPGPRLAPLVVPSRVAAGWQHCVGGEALLAVGGLAAIVAAASGQPVRDPVPALVLVPWLAVWALPAWAGLGLAAANLAVVSSRGALDPVALTVVGALWAALVLVWLHNQGLLPWLVALAWLGWAALAGAALWRQRDGAMLTELVVGLAVLAGVFVLAAAYRPVGADWSDPSDDGWTGVRLAIAAAAAAVELGWLAGQLPAWALTLAVLVPWFLAAWLAGQPRATALAWAGWMVLSVAAVYGVAWSLNPGPHWAETELVLVCGLLWGGLALGWLVTGGPGRWALGALALAALVGAGVSWWPVLAAPTWSAGLEVLCMVGMVALIAASFVPTRAPRADPVSPAGSWWPAAGPGLAAGAPWARAAPGALLAGQQAEAAMRARLLAGLPAGTWVLSGLVLPGLAGDIDLLAVGAPGAVVLEVKYWAGRIVCDQGGHAWARQRRGLVETLGDPAGQLEGQLAALAAFWQRHGCPVAGAVGGLLVFAHPRAQLEVAASPVPAVRPLRVLDVLRGCQTRSLLSAAEQARLVELVVAAQPSGWDPGRGVQRVPGGVQDLWPLAG